MIHDLNIPIKVSTDQLQAVVDTASGYAGYWELEYRNHQHGADHGVTSFEVYCKDADPTFPLHEADKWAVVDEWCVMRGLKLIIRDEPAICSQYIRASILGLLSQQDGGGGIEGCDVEQADVIVQAGLFGELVYG